MKTFLTLWHRDVQGFFLSARGYVVGAFFLLITGTTFWLLMSQLSQGTADGGLADVLFGSTGYWLALLVAAPLLTMRSFAEERRSGTLETLMTAPVSVSSIVLAKFAGAFTVYILLWLPTAAYAYLLKWCGAHLPPLDWGAMATGYFGTALLGMSCLALGLLCSLLARHQMTAAVGCLALLGVLLLVGNWTLPAHLDQFRPLVPLYSAARHMTDFRAGVVDTRAVVWHLSATVLLLFAAIQILQARRLR